MNRLLLAIAAVTAAPAVGAAPAEPAAAVKPVEARIPFVSLGGIRSFRPDGRDAVYLEDSHGRWYRAALATGCRSLPFAQAIGVDTGGSSSFDRFSVLVVEGERCHLSSLVRTAEPPRRKRG